MCSSGSPGIGQTRPGAQPAPRSSLARWTGERAHLRDDVAPFSAEIAASTARRRLAETLDTLFASFDAEPLAAALVAQVRPGVRAQIDRDMRILVAIAAVASATIPFSAAGAAAAAPSS